MEAGNGGRKLSRREVVFGGMLAAGAAAAGAPGFGLASRAEARETPLPWPYEKIDPRAAAKIAYEGFYEALCSYGVSRAIWVPLREKVGEPYVSHPLYEGLKLGGAGIAGWGTVCGALLGATVVTGFIVPAPAGEQILNDLFEWYGSAALPVFEPERPRAEVSARSVSHSPLCHISVGKWSKIAGKPLMSPEQKERCARLTADVALRTATLFNEWKDGNFHPARKLPLGLYGITAQHNCAECHPGKPPDAVK